MILNMIKEGKIAGRAVLLAGQPGTGRRPKQRYTQDSWVRSSAVQHSAAHRSLLAEVDQGMLGNTAHL